MTRNVVILACSLAISTAVSVSLSAHSAWSFEHHKTRQVVYSPNGKFYAVSDPKEETTTLYSIKQNMEDKQKLWSIAENFENFHVSEDGQFLATLSSEWSRVHIKEITKDCLHGVVAVTFHSKDGKSIDLTLDRLLKDPKKLKISDYKDEYNWGHVVGFDEDNHLIIDTVEKHRFEIDSRTDAIVTDEDHNAKK